jgi:histidine ammonia-lyase
MMAQYTAAALVSENKSLAHPASVDSIPTSANQEDHVSMGTIASRKAGMILNNVRRVLAIELLCAAQAIDLRIGAYKTRDSDPINVCHDTAGLAPGKGVEAAYKQARSRIPHLYDDRLLHKDINEAHEIIVSGELLASVETAIGVLS